MAARKPMQSEQRETRSNIPATSAAICLGPRASRPQSEEERSRLRGTAVPGHLRSKFSRVRQTAAKAHRPSPRQARASELARREPVESVEWAAASIAQCET